MEGSFVNSITIHQTSCKAETFINIFCQKSFPQCNLPRKQNLTQVVKEIILDDEKSIMDIGVGLMNASPLKSNKNDDNNKTKTTYNFACGIQNTMITCCLQSLSIALAQSQHMWHHLKQDDHLRTFTEKYPTTCDYFSLINVLAL